MNPAQQAVQTVDRFQRRFPRLAFPVAVWKKFGDDQAGNLAALVACLIAWLYLQAEATLYVAEANVVWVRKLWPRSLAPPPHTEEDVRADELYAEAEARNKDDTISVAIPGRPGEGGNEKAPAGPPAAARTEATWTEATQTGPEKSTVSAKRARGEDPDDSGDDR